MIVFINGSFGIGKTTVAELLTKQLKNSMLYDPEEVGVLLHTILKDIDDPGDFQHYRLWRSLTVETAKQLQREYKKDLVIPMTIWRKDYFDEVMGGLKKIDSQVHHFCLTAPLNVVHERVAKRGQHGQVPGSWVYQQAEQAVKAFESEAFATHIETDQKTPEDLVQSILSLIQAPLR